MARKLAWDTAFVHVKQPFCRAFVCCQLAFLAVFALLIARFVPFSCFAHSASLLHRFAPHAFKCDALLGSAKRGVIFRVFINHSSCLPWWELNKYGDKIWIDGKPNYRLAKSSHSFMLREVANKPVSNKLKEEIWIETKTMQSLFSLPRSRSLGCHAHPKKRLRVRLVLVLLWLRPAVVH